MVELMTKKRHITLVRQDYQAHEGRSRGSNRAA